MATHDLRARYPAVRSPVASGLSYGAATGPIIRFGIQLLTVLKTELKSATSAS
jgi:hypothetical protein